MKLKYVLDLYTLHKLKLNIYTFLFLGIQFIYFFKFQNSCQIINFVKIIDVTFHNKKITHLIACN